MNYFFSKVRFLAWRKAVSAFTALTVIFSLLVTPGMVIAANIGTSALVNTFVLSGATIKASSNATPALGLNLANSTARTLSSVQATISGPTGFDPATELAALATGATSGVALYADGGVAAEDGTLGSANGDAVVTLSGAPSYSAATRASQLTPASTGTYTINGSSNTTSPALAVGDIVYYQTGTLAGVWGVVTTALSASALSINGGAVSNGTYTISKLANSTVAFTTGAAGANAWTGVSGAYTAPALGDIVMYQTGAGAATWGVVTVATNTNQDTFKINNAVLTADTAYKLSKITGYTPDTSAVNGSNAVLGSAGGGMNFAVGDLVFARITAGGNNLNAYAWHVVTTAENITTDVAPSALRLDGASAAPTFTASIQISKISASGTALATAATPTFVAGDIVFANPVLNAAPVSGYNWHVVTTGGAGPAATALRLDGAIAAAFWPYTTTLTPATPAAIPADNTTAGNVGSDFYIVLKTHATPTNGKTFNVSIRANGDVAISDSDTVNLASLPTNTNTITVDTVAPTLNANMTGPPNGATGVPIQAFIHVGFSENIDQSTINPTNVTFTAGGTAVPAGIRSFPDGFDVVVSSPPTFAASSRFSKLGSTSTAFFQASGTNPIVPQPPSGYSAPVVGDIVMTQRETFPPELGLVTNATLTSGTFAVNGFPSFGGQQITKIATPAATGAVTDATAVTAGDIIVVNTTANPTDNRYNWHMVTTAANVNGAGLRLDGASAVPTFVSGSRFSTIAPTDTSVVNGTSQVVGSAAGGINFVVGDLVFARITAGGDSPNVWAWHVVTTAENITTDAVPSTLRLDGASVAPTFTATSQVSKITPGAEGAVTASTTLTFGDIVMAKTTANASNNNAYAFHIVSGGAAVNSADLRLDNFPGSLTPSTAYVVTATTGVKDSAGNALASNQVISFTTGATGGTNTTPPAVQSSQPGPGSQNHPIGAPIKLTFSVDMASSGAGDITSASNTGLFTAAFGQPGTAITTTKTYDSATKTVTLVPASALTASTDYIVKVNTTATSTTGAPYPSPPYLLFFRTSSAADATAPTVLGVSPANAATGASLGAIVTAGFSEDIDPSTLTTTTVKLAPTSNLSATIAGAVTYNPNSKSVNFAPSTALAANTSHTFTIVSGGSGVKDLSGNALAANYTSTFTTTSTADTTKPTVTSANADNFSLAVTFSETVKSGGGPNAADNITNYTLTTGAAGATLSTVGLGGKTVTYEAGTKTARITGLSLVNGNQYSISVATTVQDLAGNTIDTNSSLGTVQNSSTTGGQIGPGGGTIDQGMQGMNPTRVTPMTKAAGVASNYKVEFLAGTTIPSGGKVVLTFPTGFTLANASAVAAANSFCNADANGLASGTVTIASVSGNNDAGTVTITTAGAATGTNSFVCFDLANITNSTVPSTSGYTVTIQTKDASDVALQTLTAAPFYLGTAGSGTLVVNVFKDANSNGTNDDNEGVNGATVFLFSPAAGGREGTTATDTIEGKVTFSNLSAGDYMVGVKPTAAIDVAFNSMPQPITIAGSGTTTKNFALSNAAAITIGGTVTGPNATKVDVFAGSSSGFAKTTLTMTGAAVAYTIPVQASTTYNVCVGPYMPETAFTPGAPPAAPPTMTFMPPPCLTVPVASSNVTGTDFTLATANRTITGTVVDSSSSGVSNAGVFCRPTESSSTASSGGFGAGGQTNTSGAFSINVNDGTYICEVFKPGMPHVAGQQITVAAAGNTPTTLAFVLDASTSLTISGTGKDADGNAIPYCGVSGRKVTSTSDTTAVGGDSSNFVGGPCDANGAYTLYVTTGTWVVEMFAPGLGFLGSKTISVTTSQSGQDFSAQTLDLVTLSGTVTGGSTVQGVMVRAEGSSGRNMVPTGSAGTYTMKLPPGTYNVSCYFPSVGDVAATGGAVTIASGGTGTRNCAAGTPITIEVKLTDGTNPIANAFVEARDSTGLGNGTGTSSSSGANATYTITVPAGGTYTVRAGHPAYGKLGETSNVTTSRTGGSAITYTAASGATVAVTGTVTSSSSACTNAAWVNYIGTPTGQTNLINFGAQTNSSGSYTVNVPPGSYRYRADKPGCRSGAEQTITVTGAATATAIALTAASRTITGTVTLSGSGVSSAFVDATDGAGGFSVDQTDSTGAFTLSVDDGTWTVRAHAPGYEGGPRSVVISGGNQTGQDITLSTISGYTVKAERTESVTPSQGGMFTNTDITGFKMTIPANALGTSSNSTTVTTKPNTGVPNSPSGSILSKNAITIKAVDSSNQPVSTFSAPVSVVVPYTDDDVAGSSSNLTAAQEANMQLVYYDDSKAAWVTVTATNDPTANTMTAEIEHLSDFAPLIPSSDSAPSTPSGLTATNALSNGSINLSWSSVSGAATYNLYRSTDNSSFPLLGSSSTTSYSDSTTAVGNLYYYKVSAVSATSAESAATTAVSVLSSTSGSSGGSSGGGGGTAPPPAATPPPPPAAVPPPPAATPPPAVITPPSTGTTNTPPAGAHRNGTLVLVDKTVYLIRNGKRFAFRNPDEYKSHGFTFSQVVVANAIDKSLPVESGDIVKALAGTLAIAAEDGKTVYMIGPNNTKRGFASSDVFKKLGYSFGNLPKIALSDYAAGEPIISGDAVHPRGALVREKNGTVWWILDGTRQGFESLAVFNTYGFPTSRLVLANSADLALPQGPLVKFRDGTLVDQNGTYYVISDGKKMKFASRADLEARGYKRTNAIIANLAAYESGGTVE